MEKAKYLEKYNYLKRRKLFIFLVILFTLSLLTGIFYFLLGSNNNKSLTLDYYNSFFTSIQNNKLNYFNCIINSISSNVLETIVLFLISISIIGIIFVFAFFIFHSFTLGYVVSSFISFYKIKGIIPMIIYILPLLIHIFLLLILSFYSFNFASKFYNYLIKKKEVDIKHYFKRYFRIFTYIILFLLINTAIESIIIPILLKTFTNSLI